MSFKKLSAAILAGGKNSRMGGENKAFLRLNGSLLLPRTISVLGPIFPAIFIVTNSPQSYVRYSDKATIIEDRIKEVGPLGGIYTALSQASTAAVFFVACDMPFLHNDLIERQVREFKKIAADVFIPRIGNRVEPLHGIYRKRIRADLISFLQGNRSHSLRDFLPTVKTAYWALKDTATNRKYFTNVNTWQELQEIRRGLRWCR